MPRRRAAGCAAGALSATPASAECVTQCAVHTLHKQSSSATLARLNMMLASDVGRQCGCRRRWQTPLCAQALCSCQRAARSPQGAATRCRSSRDAFEPAGRLNTAMRTAAAITGRCKCWSCFFESSLHHEASASTRESCALPRISVVTVAGRRSCASCATRDTMLAADSHDDSLSSTHGARCRAARWERAANTSAQRRSTRLP